MSQSHRPTRAPVCSSATARFAATVDFPTPPLPLATAITCLTPGIRVVTVPAPAPPGGAWISIKTLALRMPSIVRKARSASFLIVAGTFGSFVASASCTLTSPLSIWIDFTNPKEMMSRVKPGYFTDFNTFFTCSSEIDIGEFTCGTPNVNCTDSGLAKTSLRFVVLLLVLDRSRGRRRGQPLVWALLVLAIQIIPKLDGRSRRTKPWIVRANWPAPIVSRHEKSVLEKGTEGFDHSRIRFGTLQRLIVNIGRFNRA